MKVVVVALFVLLFILSFDCEGLALRLKQFTAFLLKSVGTKFPPLFSICSLQAVVHPLFSET